jgi:hypothetical protein
MFTPKISLVQAEDIRLKLARISCAIAGRLFSTDNGETLVVKREHAEYAYNFIVQIYSKPCCGYSQLSMAEKERSVLPDSNTVIAILKSVGDGFNDLISGLLEHRQISINELCDYAGIDLYQARALISALVRKRALVKEYNWYVKLPAFRKFLIELKSQMATDPHVADMPDDIPSSVDSTEEGR